MHDSRNAGAAPGQPTRRQAIAALAGAALGAGGLKGGYLVDDPLLASLDLERPDMAAVRQALDRADPDGARAALARHLRERPAPRWHFDPGSPPANCGPDERAEADRALKHVFEVGGIRHAFAGPIDWALNPTTRPGSPDPPDHEWTWQFNRHGAWDALARAYTATRDPRYARELVAEMLDWVHANPAPEGAAQQGPFSRWRTIEAGIRMFSAWPEAYHRLLRHPDVFPDDALLTMVDCMRRHAAYLDAHPTGGNWLCMEANGQFHVAALFPELRDAARWRESALTRLRREVDAQVYPDGAQIELTPGYHNVSLSNFVGTLALARLNDIPLPDGYQAGLERMFAVNLRVMSPDRDLPQLNDSWSVDVRPILRQGVGLFPAHRDWAWVASDGRDGERPSETSCLLPWAGWAVMRSGWGRDARYMIVDAGPFGYGHQHEDKLSFVLHAFGARLVFDAGSYAYDASDMRRYALSARGHNVVHVDSREQNRRPGPRERFVAREPFPLTWSTTDDYDYLQASFGALPEERWGPERLANVVHTRCVLFVKPDYWVVADTLAASDGEEHLYECTFHLDAEEAPVEAASLAARLRGAAAEMAVIPLAREGLRAAVIVGRREPTLQGWLPLRHNERGASPRPCLVYSRRAAGTTRFVTVFSPAPRGGGPAVRAVRPATPRPGEALRAAIVTGSGEHAFALLETGGALHEAAGRRFGPA